jgi:hypothetical protein
MRAQNKLAQRCLVILFWAAMYVVYCLLQGCSPTPKMQVEEGRYEVVQKTKKGTYYLDRKTGNGIYIPNKKQK